ncbi:TusE/DsrC/DsvC family sulfur relay protein [Reinekea sp. G2M2-21]|uniref:TusE/DsrC/DsvC family sulfur relay protein n=1 Tax=Reinekea sp. G2M2-21 TaxID=2788942 RepID=UPI0018AAD82A|nr:TusE/DsrC/DsvC family sulfur relay protein [Reinekea sp. G2M2-21]
MTFQTDNLGFLANAKDWTPDWAQSIANTHGLQWESLDEQIVEALRQFYFEYDLSPAMRPLVKHIKNTLGEPYGSSIWLMQRYGESPARMLALLAGLPKPKNCL